VSIWGCPNGQQQHEKNSTIFWLFWTISPKRMGLMIWLGAYFQAQTLGHTFHPLQAFMYIFGSQHEKNYFLIVWEYSPKRMGLMI
jgi:hypothetical protein